MDRLIIAHTPLPSHQLLFRSLSGEEKLAGLFEFDVELLSPDNRLDLKALLGQKSRWSCGQSVGAALSQRQYHAHDALRTRSRRQPLLYLPRRAAPTLWYLTQNRDFRIYQKRPFPTS